MKKHNKRALATAFIILCLIPGIAAAGPIENATEWLLELLTSGIARSAAIIMCAVLGYAAWVGKLTWERAGQFIAGIVFVFGAVSIVDTFIAAVGT